MRVRVISQPWWCTWGGWSLLDMDRECHGFTNPYRLRSRIVTGTGTGWWFITPAKPIPMTQVWWVWQMWHWLWPPDDVFNSVQYHHHLQLPHRHLTLLMQKICQETTSNQRHNAENTNTTWNGGEGQGQRVRRTRYAFLFLLFLSLLILWSPK